MKAIPSSTISCAAYLMPQEFIDLLNETMPASRQLVTPGNYEAARLEDAKYRLAVARNNFFELPEAEMRVWRSLLRHVQSLSHFKAEQIPEAIESAIEHAIGLGCFDDIVVYDRYGHNPYDKLALLMNRLPAYFVFGLIIVNGNSHLIPIGRWNDGDLVSHPFVLGFDYSLWRAYRASLASVLIAPLLLCWLALRYILANPISDNSSMFAEALSTVLIFGCLGCVTFTVCFAIRIARDRWHHSPSPYQRGKHQRPPEL